VGDNAVSRLSSEITGPAGSLRRGRMRDVAGRTVERFRIKTGNVAQPIRSLSGGNQQKVAIASAVNTRPRVLVLEEPTRGVDIQSKREIYRILRAFARQGHAILLYCTEVTEVFDVADRVHVVAEGRIADPLRVAAYPDVETLAADITARERSAVPTEAAAATAAR
jgi:ABC-type sugar transport system ATPase subunit